MSTKTEEKVWTIEGIQALGARTDFKTACQIIGISRTKGSQMVNAGTPPFPILRLGRKIVVPVAPLLQLLQAEQVA